MKLFSNINLFTHGCYVLIVCRGNIYIKTFLPFAPSLSPKEVVISDDKKCTSFHQVQHNSISATKVWFSPCYFYASLSLLILLAAKVGKLFMKHFPFPMLPARDSQSLPSDFATVVPFKGGSG